jgi:hypothetical protein
MASVLEQVTQMINEGIPEQEIVSRLREQRVSPREINDAMNQAQIKSAVSDVSGSNSLQPSVMSGGSSSYSSNETYTPPQPGQGYPQAQDYYPQQTQQDYYPQQDYYQEGGYEEYPSEGEGSSADTMIEIAEQVFSEKIKKIQKQIEEINEFKTLAQTKLDNSVERLKKVEATMDKLQAAILDKVGSYGKNLDSIKKEMSMMQDSFGKIVKGIAERKHSPSEHSSTHKKTSSRKKK